MAKGISQIPGIDFEDVFSLVPKLATIRVMLALSDLFGWKRCFVDVKNAFVNPSLKEEIYIDQLEGFPKTGKQNFLYLLMKVLYGLGQASRESNVHLHEFLTNFNCEISVADPTIYMWNKNTHFVILLFTSTTFY